MNPTKKDIYDMSAGEVKLNLDAMIDVAMYAVRNAKESMERAESEIHRDTYNRKNTEATYHANHHAQFYAQILAQYAQQYADAWRVYFALTEARTRETFILIRDEDQIKKDD